MLWIKRNLVVSIGGLVALVLIGGGVFFLYSNVQKNRQFEEQLSEQIGNLKRLRGSTPALTPENIEAMKKELVRVGEAVGKTQSYFTPVSHQEVTGLAFKTLLDNTIAQLKEGAARASVQLPNEDYAFSFKHEKQALSLPPASFPALPGQLAEVSEICSVLFRAKVNRIENLRRPRITGQEPPGAEDYHALITKTNEVTKMVVTPYEVTFLSFSGDLAKISDDFVESKHGFIVKALLVEGIPTEKPLPGKPGGPPGRRRGRSAAVAAPVTKDGLETVIDERRLKITLLLNVIKPAA